MLEKIDSVIQSEKCLDREVYRYEFEGQYRLMLSSCKSVVDVFFNQNTPQSSNNIHESLSSNKSCRFYKTVSLYLCFAYYRSNEFDEAQNALNAFPRDSGKSNRDVEMVRELISQSSSSSSSSQMHPRLAASFERIVKNTAIRRLRPVHLFWLIEVSKVLDKPLSFQNELKLILSEKI